MSYPAATAPATAFATPTTATTADKAAADNSSKATAAEDQPMGPGPPAAAGAAAESRQLGGESQSAAASAPDSQEGWRGSTTCAGRGMQADQQQPARLPLAQMLRQLGRKGNLLGEQLQQAPQQGTAEARGGMGPRSALIRAPDAHSEQGGPNPPMPPPLPTQPPPQLPLPPSGPETHEHLSARRHVLLQQRQKLQLQWDRLQQPDPQQHDLLQLCPQPRGLQQPQQSPPRGSQLQALQQEGHQQGGGIRMTGEQQHKRREREWEQEQQQEQEQERHKVKRGQQECRGAAV